MKNNILNLSLVLLLGLGLSAPDTNKGNLKTQTINVSTNMNSYLSIFEVPATDFPRAVKFYENVLEISIESIELDGITMGLFPSEGQAIAGNIVKGEGYEPAANGVIIYLNGGDNLQPMLDRAIANGGEVALPKTQIDEENGYFAMFLDTEGNRVGLHSPH